MPEPERPRGFEEMQKKPFYCPRCGEYFHGKDMRNVEALKQEVLCKICHEKQE